jgi:hypothetical protein
VIMYFITLFYLSLFDQLRFLFCRCDRAILNVCKTRGQRSKLMSADSQMA